MRSRVPSSMPATTSLSSCSRPTNELAGRGRFVFEIVLSGGKLGLTSWEVFATRACDVLQAVLAEIGQRDIVEVRASRQREDDLAAMSCRRDPRREVHIVSNVALVGHERRTGVQSNA